MRKAPLLYALLILLWGAGLSCTTKSNDIDVSNIGAPVYPLDPPTADEMKKVVQILKDSQTITGNDIFNIYFCGQNNIRPNDKF